MEIYLPNSTQQLRSINSRTLQMPVATITIPYYALTSFGSEKVADSWGFSLREIGDPLLETILGPDGERPPVLQMLLDHQDREVLDSNRWTLLSNHTNTFHLAKLSLNNQH